MPMPWEKDWSGGAPTAPAVPAAPAGQQLLPWEKDWSGGGASPSDNTAADEPGVNITIRPGARQQAAAPAPAPSFLDRAGSTAADVANSAGAGVLRGGIGLFGAPADLAGLVDTGIKKASQAVTGESDADYAKRYVVAPETLAQGGSKALTGYFEDATGPLYQPQTRLGRLANTIGELVPGGAVGASRNALRNAVTYGAVPGAASEAAGQATEGTAVEPYARAATAVAAGGIGALFNAPNSAASAIRGATHGVDDAALNASENLFQEAQRMGTPISRAEALQHVTNGATRMGDLQRVVEGSGGMREFYAGRPAANDAAAGRAFDDITMPTSKPSQVGPALGEAADHVISETEGAINRGTRPLYQAAEQQRIPPAVFAQVKADPVFQEGLRRVRNDPWIGPTLKAMPDDSVAIVDAVKKQLDETGRNLRNPGNADRNNFSASIVDQGRNRAVSAADAATGSTPSQVGTYELARMVQQEARQRYLDPLMKGPIGKIAGKDTTTRQAIDALFPANPLPNSQQEISRAVGALASKNAWATRQLVRAHAESTFNEATQRLPSGANQFGGAGFVAALRGNPQQAANLEAAVRALPQGNDIWRGFDRFLSVLEAQGERQAIGSRTSFNTETLNALKQGNLVSEAGSALATGGLKVPAKIMDALQRWRMGNNVDQLAKLLTEPDAAPAFRALVRSRSANQAAALTARLGSLALKGAMDARPSEPR
jgi:hypothetical protein